MNLKALMIWIVGIQNPRAIKIYSFVAMKAAGLPAPLLLSRSDISRAGRSRHLHQGSQADA